MGLFWVCFDGFFLASLEELLYLSLLRFIVVMDCVDVLQDELLAMAFERECAELISE